MDFGKYLITDAKKEDNKAYKIGYADGLAGKQSQSSHPQLLVRKIGKDQLSAYEVGYADGLTAYHKKGK